VGDYTAKWSNFRLGDHTVGIKGRSAGVCH
jgi:hypothetical protein